MLDTPSVDCGANHGENPYLEGNYAPVEVETTSFDLPTKGSIPEELSGRLLRIGPNPITAVDPQKYHWFQGTGMVHGVRLRNGRAEWYRSRYVLSDPVAKSLGRHTFLGPKNGERDFSPNTHVMKIGAHVHALVEAGSLPVELNYELESVSRSNLNGTLKNGFAAHSKLDPATGELHAMCYQPGLQAVSYVVVDREGRARTIAEIPAPDCPMVHDMAITPTTAVFLDLPVRFDLKAAMAGSAVPFGWNENRPPRVGLVPRNGDSSKVQWYEVPLCYVFHVLNAYDADDRVIVDVVRHERVFDSERRGPLEPTVSRLVRWEFNRSNGRFSESVLEERGCEFPRINDARSGLPYRYGYTASVEGLRIGPTYKHDVTKARTEVHDHGPGRVGLEPIFVPRGNTRAEDDGWILNYVYDANRQKSDVVIIEAGDFAGKPLATIELPVRVPFGFHGNWIPDSF
ncbi:carotenoid oxygenase family protein [Tardiphaga sp. 866_E4_N2_1]|uniref:carotenoid oxygenase family protein n=1 Tax=unclassified Tardiphaga TaxID=2631404 RepID=UPI003F28B789